MSRNKRRHLRFYLRKLARLETRRRRQRPAAQPWHRRYRDYILVPLIIGYALIYAFNGAPLRLANPMLSYQAIDYSATLEDGENDSR